MAVTLTLILSLPVVLWLIVVNFAKRKRAPGPRGFPIIGNALDIPKDRQWLTWDHWRKEYGLIYSDRPRAIMVGELVGWGQGLGYTPGPPNPRFKEFRRLFSAFIGHRAVESPDIQTVEQEENVKLLAKLLDSPDKFMDHTRDSKAAVLLRLAYGYHPSSESNDSLGLVKIVEDAMAGFSAASEPGWWVDSFPLLRHISGLPFQYAAKKMKQDLDLLYSVPYEYVKTATVMSFISAFLDDKHGQETKEDENTVKIAAASLYSGMSRFTSRQTVSSLNSYFLAMALYPRVQQKAQAQVDAYLSTINGNSGDLRFPSVSDRPHLRYVEALFLEILRWQPSVPLGLPHVAKEDDIYRGCHIKKGTVIWANMWSILHDEQLFPDPQVFKPERYLNEYGELARNSKQATTARSAFGFGRRICPGLYLAETSLLVDIATLLYTMNVSKQEGQDPEPYYGGFISQESNQRRGANPSMSLFLPALVYVFNRCQ
ncbi:cytochrome P450 [Coprinopsis marcescibilis]|uniref:Cytochrome P450 n=1 Tax=Coprinopsis marcescibilis TaxID=230819 RepID=A0A5C3KNR3_COPMA|nr:cytochrome P450 [Coprinopsis marcescibilis]